MSTLYVVATPIGNLEDLTFRAKRVLAEVDFVLAEDTRVTRKLLSSYDLKTPMISYHQHSGAFKIEKIIALLREGKNLALVTDAGTPGISDPGGHLVSAVRSQLGEEVRIESIPGVAALTAAVSIAGEGFDRFLFLGFLPHKKGRQTLLKEIAASLHPVILYESKHRILRLLTELEAVFAEDESPEISVARELTKLHESLYAGSAPDVRRLLGSDPNNLKGEFVVMIKKK